MTFERKNPPSSTTEPSSSFDQTMIRGHSIDQEVTNNNNNNNNEGSTSSTTITTTTMTRQHQHNQDRSSSIINNRDEIENSSSPAPVTTVTNNIHSTNSLTGPNNNVSSTGGNHTGRIYHGNTVSTLFHDDNNSTNNPRFNAVPSPSNHNFPGCRPTSGSGGPHPVSPSFSSTSPSDGVPLSMLFRESMNFQHETSTTIQDQSLSLSEQQQVRSSSSPFWSRPVIDVNGSSISNNGDCNFPQEPPRRRYNSIGKHSSSSRTIRQMLNDVLTEALAIINQDDEDPSYSSTTSSSSTSTYNNDNSSVIVSEHQLQQEDKVDDVAVGSSDDPKNNRSNSNRTTVKNKSEGSETHKGLHDITTRADAICVSFEADITDVGNTSEGSSFFDNGNSNDNKKRAPNPVNNDEVQVPACKPTVVKKQKTQHNKDD